MNPMTQDEEHLRLLSTFHYVVGGLAGLFSLLPTLHLIVGLIFILAAGAEGNGDPPPAFIGWILVLFAGAAICFGLIVAVLILTTGRFLGMRKHYTFCLVMGGFECMFMPFGTVLGVFTIIVLMRESVKQLFTARNALPAPA